MKICHVTSVHKQDDIRVFRKECVSLAKKGWDVTFLVANGYDEINENVKIVSFSLRAKSRFSRIRKAPKLAYEAAIKVDADIYHFHDPELIPMGIKLIKIGKKAIYDSHEDVPGQIKSKHYIPKILRGTISKFAELYEKRQSKKLTYVVSATPYIRDKFIRYGAKSIDINNFPLLSELPERTGPTERKNQVCYVGGLTEVRGVKTMMAALEYTDVRLILAGLFSDKDLQSEVESMPTYAHCDYLGFVDRQNVVKVLSESKVGLVVLHHNLNYINSQPIKMYEYMSMGLPVVASNFPLWQSFMDTNQCGICVDPNDPIAIANAINYIIDNPIVAKEMGERGEKLVYEKYNWDSEEQKLINLYESLAK